MLPEQPVHASLPRGVPRGRPDMSNGDEMHRAVHHYPGEGFCIKCPECGQYHVAPERPDFDEALALACQEMQPSTMAQYAAFSVGDTDGRWDMNPDDGVFVFTQGNGRKSSAGYSLVGSWIDATASWMWAWELPATHITPKTRRAADLARALGQRQDWPVLTTPMLLVGEHEAWHLTNLAGRLAGHALVYRARVNEKATVYFAIDALSWMN